MRSIQSYEFLERDLSSFTDYSRVIESVSRCAEEFANANEAYSCLGSLGLTRLMAAAAPNVTHGLEELKPALRDYPGVIILHDTGIDQCPDKTAQLLSIGIGSIYGKPTKTDRKNKQIAWPIKYDPDTAVRRTFSQSLSEAAFHTDTQYFDKPEEYFGLFCVYADEPGKGTNELIAAESIANAYKKEYGEEDFLVLTRPFPFRVPSVFTKTGSDDDVEIIWAPIFTEYMDIRYRKDTIQGALTAENIELEDDNMKALERMEAVIHEIKPLRYHLQPGDAILVNNFKLLHARTAFENPERSLYRVRMREDAI